MAMNKNELLRAKENLPTEQLKLVSDYVDQATEDKGLNMKSFNFVIDNCGEALKKLSN